MISASLLQGESIDLVINTSPNSKPKTIPLQARKVGVFTHTASKAFRILSELS